MTKMTSVDSSMLRRWKGPWGKRKKKTDSGYWICFGFWFLCYQGHEEAGEETESLGQSGSCHFAAVFNFGDSNSDTGGMSATMAGLRTGRPPSVNLLAGFPMGG